MRSALLTVACAFALFGGVSAQDWPHWRGPNYDGSATAKNLPLDFGTEERVRWSVDMPGPGACTPIVIGDRVFLSSVDSKKERLVALCLDCKTGKTLWSRATDSGYPEGARSRTSSGRRSNYASPSPTTDGERVVFFFGNGDLVAFDYSGKELWRRNLQKDYGKFAFQWTFSASPTLWEGKLFLPVLQRDTPLGRRGRGFGGGRDAGGATPEPIQSFLLAMDPNTGATLYRHTRASDARVESRESYATPIPFVNDEGQKQLLVVGGDVITGHDPASGKELWRWGTWNDGHRQRSWRLVPTAVVGAGQALVCAPKREPVYAVKLGGEGDLGEAGLAWQSKGRPNPVSSDVPSPAFHGGHFYVLSDVRSALSKVEAKTGEVVWTAKLPRDYPWRASPTVADGNVFCINHNGAVAVVDMKSGTIVHEALMAGMDADQIRSSVVVAHDSLFIRTDAKLYRIGK